MLWRTEKSHNTILSKVGNCGEREGKKAHGNGHLGWGARGYLRQVMWGNQETVDDEDAVLDGS